MALTLHGAALSPFVRKIRVVLAEKNLPYTHVQIDPARKTPALLELNPLGRIPVLDDGDVRLADSSVIATYLDARYPQSVLRPSDPAALAQVLWIEKFADYELAPLCTFTVFRERVLAGLRGVPVDEAAVQTALTERLPPLFDYLERFIAGRTLCEGATLTIADIAVAVQIVNMQYAGECLDAARWPALAAWVARVCERPALAGFIAEEAPLAAKLRSRSA